MENFLATLAAEAKAGDKKTEQELFSYLLVRFTTFAKRRVGDMQAAEDIAQEACRTIFEKYKTETFTISFAAWAYGVLRKKIGNYLQKKKHAAIEQELGTAGDCYLRRDDPELRRRMIHCMKLLIKKKRTYARALNLSYQGYKTDEICHKLRITQNNLYVILSRARRLLKNCLQRGVI